MGYAAQPAPLSTALFNGMDRNNDGVVTRAEFNQAFAPQAQPVTYAAPPVQTVYAAQPAPLTTAFFNAADRNNDGVVTRAEFNQAFVPQAQPYVPQVPTYAAPPAVYAQPTSLSSALFNAVDRNNDGVMSRAEFNQAFATRAA